MEKFVMKFYAFLRDDLKPTENQLVVSATTPEYADLASMYNNLFNKESRIQNRKQKNKKKVHGQNRIKMYESGDYDRRPVENSLKVHQHEEKEKFIPDADDYKEYEARIID